MKQIQERLVRSPRLVPCLLIHATLICFLLFSPQCSINGKEGLCKQSRFEGSQERGTCKLQGTAAETLPTPWQPSALSNPHMNQKGKCEPLELPVGMAGIWRRSLGLEVAMQTG